jgi:hypothetical protein
MNEPGEAAEQSRSLDSETLFNPWSVNFHHKTVAGGQKSPLVHQSQIASFQKCDAVAV